MTCMGISTDAGDRWRGTVSGAIHNYSAPRSECLILTLQGLLWRGWQLRSF